MERKALAVVLAVPISAVGLACPSSGQDPSERRGEGVRRLVGSGRAVEEVSRSPGCGLGQRRDQCVAVPLEHEATVRRPGATGADSGAVARRRFGPAQA